jgi:hypothetical protein
MNSWLNELPGLHPAGKGNQVVINPADAAALSERPRRGVVTCCAATLTFRR